MAHCEHRWLWNAADMFGCVSGLCQNVMMLCLPKKDKAEAKALIAKARKALDKLETLVDGV